MDSSDFSPGGTAGRSSHLCLFFSVLPSRDFGPPTPRQGTQPDGTPDVGEVWADANDERLLPDDRREGVALRALHPAGARPEVAAGADELAVAAAVTAKNHGKRRAGKRLQTFRKSSLIFNDLHA